MKLLWHLIRKDLVALRLWLLAWLAAVATHFVLRAIQFAHGDAALPERFTTSNRPDYLALLLLIALIVPQALQLDPPARAGAFWKMLPLSRWRVLLAKLVFIGGCFIVLPAIFEAAYFIMAGFGSWTWPAVGAWFWNTAPLVLIVAGAGALARDLRVAALLIGAAVLALLPEGVGTLRALFAQHGPTLAGAIGQGPVLAITQLGWQLVVASLVIVPWQYLARGRFGWWAAGAAFSVAWFLGLATPAQIPAPKKEIIRKVEGVQVEVDPWNSSINTMYLNHGELSSIGIYIRVNGIPAGMEIEKITMPDGRLIRGVQTIHPSSEAELKEKGMLLEDRAEVRARDWFHVAAPAGPDGLRVVHSPYFAMNYDEIAAVPTALEGTVRVQLKRVQTISGQPLQPGVYWHSGLHRAGIVSAGHDGDATLAIRQRLESGLVDPAGESVSPATAEPLRVRLHQVPLNQWIDLTALSPGPGAFQFGDNTFSAPGESLAIQPRQDRTRSLHEEFADYRLDFDQLAGSTELPPLVRARFREGVSDLSAWRLEIQSRETFIADVPIKLPGVIQQENAWRRAKDAGGPRQALGDALTALTVRELNNAQAVDDYLHTLFNLIGGNANGDLRHYDNTILLTLALVGPDNLEALCRWGQRAGEPALGDAQNYDSGSNDWHRHAPGADYRCNQFRHVVIDLAKPQHKDLILRSNTPQFDLLDAIREHGWLDDALPRMCALAENQPVPEGWTALFAAHPGPATDAAILAQCRLGSMSTQQLALAAARPGGGLQSAISASWRTATERTANPASLFHIFALACKYGLPEMPGDLRTLIDAARPSWIRESDFESSRRTLLDVFALHSDCPTDLAFARPWLAEHATALRFNSQTQRYELH